MDNFNVLEEQIRKLSCGDSSCSMVAPRGMSTNGGCRCGGRDYGPEMRKVRGALQLRRRQVEQLVRERDEARACYAAAHEERKLWHERWDAACARVDELERLEVGAKVKTDLPDVLAGHDDECEFWSCAEGCPIGTPPFPPPL